MRRNKHSCLNALPFSALVALSIPRCATQFRECGLQISSQGSQPRNRKSTLVLTKLVGSRKESLPKFRKFADRVPFSIGKVYISRWSHLRRCRYGRLSLLGRPWQFDVNATYKCKENKYPFEWHGRKIALVPTPPTAAHDSLPPATLLAISELPATNVSRRVLLPLHSDRN